MITRDRLRTWWPLLAVVGAMLAVGLVAGAPPADGPPLDPTSTGSTGTKALVDTLRLLGADVSVQSGAPGPSATTALLLEDGLDDATRDSVAAWVEAGGTLVVTDVSSPSARWCPPRRPTCCSSSPSCAATAPSPPSSRSSGWTSPAPSCRRCPGRHRVLPGG